MSPSCRLKSVLLLAALLVLSLTSPGFANINRAGALLVPATVAPKYCSGAFRYAARDGNSEITPLSPVQIFAKDRRFARTRSTERAMLGLGTETSRLHALNAMCR